MRLLAPALLLLAAVSQAQEPNDWHWTDVPRVVAVGDVHGAYPALVGLLQATGLIDEKLQWTGGTTHLVSLGDLIDRGPESRRVMDLLMALQSEAPQHGGQVHVVLGNHELMNLMGDLRYVTAADFAAFAADETPAMRDRAYTSYAAEQTGDVDETALRAQFDATYAAGYFARAEAFSPTGRYGSWLLSRPAIIVVNGTAYLHGGLPEIVAQSNVAALNARIHDEIERYLQLRKQLEDAGVLPVDMLQHDHETASSALETATGDTATWLKEFIALSDAQDLGIDGPFWYRGSVYCRPIVERPKLEAALDALDAKRAVVGHTPSDDRRVQGLYGGELIMLDTGMLASYYSGMPAALVEEPTGDYVQYLGADKHGEIELGGRHEAYARTREALIDALETGAANVLEKPDAAPWKIAVDAGGSMLEAVFYPSRGDAAPDYELAAAALDGALETAIVPPTVARTLDGTPGALQLRYPDGMTETERLNRKLGFPGWCPIQPQVSLMQTFDVLTANRGRSFDNIVYHDDLSQLMLIDFSKAFGTERQLPASFDPATLSLPEALVTTLRSLDESKLQTLFGGRLRKAQIRALLVRRDALLEGR